MWLYPEGKFKIQWVWWEDCPEVKQWKVKTPISWILKEYAFKKSYYPLHFNDSDNCVNSWGFFGASRAAGKSDRWFGNPHGTSLSVFMFLAVFWMLLKLIPYELCMLCCGCHIEEIAADIGQKVEDKLSTVSVIFEKIK